MLLLALVGRLVWTVSVKCPFLIRFVFRIIRHLTLINGKNASN